MFRNHMMPKFILISLCCGLFYSAHAKPTTHIFLSDCIKEKTANDLNVCLTRNKIKLIKYKKQYLNRVKKHLRHRPRVWQLLQAEEKAFHRYMDTMSQLIYDEYIDGSIRHTLTPSIEVSLLEDRIRALAILAYPNNPKFKVKFNGISEDQIKVEDKNYTKIYDFRCSRRNDWYACAQQQKQQLRPVLLTYRNTVFNKLGALPSSRYRTENQHGQAYHQAAIQFGKAMWHNKYAGQVWGNHAIKARINALSVFLVSDDHLPPQPIILLN